MNHWAGQYVGLPWQAGAQGPEAFDCWALVRHVLAQHFGIAVPPVEVDAFDLRAVVRTFSDHDEHARWRQVDSARNGDVILFGRSRIKPPVHCGVAVDGGVLHALQGLGVIYQPLTDVRRQWGRVDFYRLRA